MLQLGKVKTQDIQFPIAFGIGTQFIYKKAFKSDLLMDLDNFSDQSQVAFTHDENHRKAMQIVWAFAKTANPKLKKPNVWIKQFIGHDPQEIFVQATKLLMKGVK